MSKYLFLDDMLVNVLQKEQKPSGGAAVQTCAWIHGLMNQGHDVASITDWAGEEELKEEYKDFKLIALYDRNRGIRWLRWLYYRIPFIYKSIRQNKPDYFIQGIPGWTSTIYGVICLLLSVKYVIRVSNDNIIDHRISQFYGKWHIRLLNLGLTMSYAIICQNNYQFEQLTKRFPRKKIIKFGNPFYNQGIGHLVPFNERKYIAWIGLFQYQKNMELLYDIASTLPNYLFRIAGKECSSNMDISARKSLAKLKTLNNVQFTGFIDRNSILKFLTQSKFLLNTSHYEGFSNTFLEAMFCGTPIISTKGANPDSIINKKLLGMIYETPYDIAYFIDNLSENNYNLMSQRCVKYVNEFHDPYILAAKLSSFLCES